MYPYSIDVAHGEGRYRISIFALVAAEGLSVTLMGGERPHVGGTVLSVPRASLKENKVSCDTWVVPVPGHKDTDVALRVAEFITRETERITSVTAGIHIDKASIEEIDILISNSMEAAKRLVAKIKALGEGLDA